MFTVFAFLAIVFATVAADMSPAALKVARKGGEWIVINRTQRDVYYTYCFRYRRELLRTWGVVGRLGTEDVGNASSFTKPLILSTRTATPEDWARANAPLDGRVN